MNIATYALGFAVVVGLCIAAWKYPKLRAVLLAVAAAVLGAMGAKAIAASLEDRARGHRTAGRLRDERKRQTAETAETEAQLRVVADADADEHADAVAAQDNVESGRRRLES